MPPITDSLTQTSQLTPVRSLISTEVSAPEIRDNSCNSCLDFTSSDATPDRYAESIAASGWKLDNYQRNPVFQNAHQYGDILFTLGKALITEVRQKDPSPSPGKGLKGEGYYLYQRIQFATNANPMAKIAYDLYKGKFLNAVSVGFVPLKWEDMPSAECGMQSAECEAKAAGRQLRRRHLEQELLEVSAVAIPANPNALTLAYKEGAVEKSDLRELSDLLKLTLEPSPHHSTTPPLQLSPLLPLVRELRDLVKRL